MLHEAHIYILQTYIFHGTLRDWDMHPQGINALLSFTRSTEPLTFTLHFDTTWNLYLHQLIPLLEELHHTTII